MADQTRLSKLEELRRAVRNKEHELSELDVMLSDYQAERFRLIRELRRLWVQLGDAEEAAILVPEP